MYTGYLFPAQSQLDLFLDTLNARKQTKGRHFNQSGEAMSRVKGGNGYSKNTLICDCAGEPTHAITTLLSNSLFLCICSPDLLKNPIATAACLLSS